MKMLEVVHITMNNNVDKVKANFIYGYLLAIEVFMSHQQTLMDMKY